MTRLSQRLSGLCGLSLSVCQVNSFTSHSSAKTTRNYHRLSVTSPNAVVTRALVTKPQGTCQKKKSLGLFSLFLLKLTNPVSPSNAPMSEPSYSIFKDVNSITIGTATIKTASDHSRTVLNVNPYINHGQHASGGRIDNYNEERRPVSAQDFQDSPNIIVPEFKPTHERVKSAPAVVESQPSSRQPLSKPFQDDPPQDLKAVKAKNDIFAELWTEALEKHKKKTGIDIQDRRNEFVQLFDDCEDIGDALGVLEDLPLFKKAGGRASWVKLKGSLKKVLDVAIVLNTLAAEVGNAAVPHFGKLIFVGTGLLLKATRDVSHHADALEKLFSRLAAFLSRLEVRGRAKVQPSSKKIFIKILVELLNALTIATVMVKGGVSYRVTNVVKKMLFDEDDIEKVLSKLSELTEEESAMVLAELAASRHDIEELVKEVGGLDTSVRVLARQIRSVLGKGNLDYQERNKLSSLLQSTKTDDRTEVLRILQLLKIEDDGTKTTLNRIEGELQELRNYLARNTYIDQSVTNGQAGHETSGNDDRSAVGVMQDTYDDYVNYGQHVAGGKVEIRTPETTAPPVNFKHRPQPERPISMPAGTSRDRFGSYANYGQHVTNGEVIISGPKTIIQQ